MKKILFYAILFLSLPAILLAQAMKEITDKHKKHNYTEVYHVLRSDKSIKHGLYQYFLYDKLRLEGFYKDGLKDSVWTQYDNSRGVLNHGSYLRDKKVGIWEYFDNNGELLQKYDHSNDNLIYFKTQDTTKIYYTVNGNDTVKSNLDRAPLYIGGKWAMYREAVGKVFYPMEAINKGIQGVVNIAFVIDTTGKAYGHKIVKGIGGGCDELSLSNAITISNNWIPGLLNGKPVKTLYIIPFSFKLEQ